MSIRNKIKGDGVKRRLACLVSNPEVAELVTNIRRNIRHMHIELTPGDDRDSRLIDYLNHMDTLAQQIEIELGC